MRQANLHHQVERLAVLGRYVGMPTFHISVANDAFSASSSHEVPTQEAAAKEGLRSALAIGSDELIGGETQFRANVCVDGKSTVTHFTVSLSVTTA